MKNIYEKLKVERRRHFGDYCPDYKVARVRKTSSKANGSKVRRIEAVVTYKFYCPAQSTPSIIGTLIEILERCFVRHSSEVPKKRPYLFFHKVMACYGYIVIAFPFLLYCVPQAVNSVRKFVGHPPSDFVSIFRCNCL